MQSQQQKTKPSSASQKSSNLYQNFQKQKGNQFYSKENLKIMQHISNQRQADSIRPSLQGLQPPSRPSLKNQAIERISINFRQQLNQQLKTESEENSPNKETKKEITEKDIIKIQAIIRAFLAKQNAKKIRKNHKYRQSIINELLMTEAAYVQGLEIVITHLLNPLKKLTGNNKIISSKDIELLFGNIEAILQLANSFYNLLSQFKYTYTSKIADQLIEISAFFKIYNIYQNNYNQAVKHLITLKKENKNFKNFLSKVEQEQFKQGIENLMIKPIQRLPKYSLLLKDLLKNTNPMHPDYKNIEEALVKFNKVNEHNNSVMDKLLVNAKLFELQKLYGHKVKILEAKREFKKEESLCIFWLKQKLPVIVYFLSDLVLVTEREQNTKQDFLKQEFIRKGEITYNLLTYVILNDQSVCREIEDLQHVQNLFLLTGHNEAITLITDTMKSKNDLIDFINELIKELKEKSMSNAIQLMKQHQNKSPEQSLAEIIDNQKKTVIIQVQIQGSREVEETSNLGQFYTEYIVEIQINNITQNIYLRYKQFTQLQSLVKDKLPNLKLPYVKDQNILSKKDPKVIETRKLQIMNFLQSLLNSLQNMPIPINQNNARINSDIEEILKYLGLQKNFFQLPELLEKEMQPQRSDSFSSLTQLRTTRKMPNPTTAFENFGSNFTSTVSIRDTKENSFFLQSRGPIRAVYQMDQQKTEEEKLEKSQQAKEFTQMRSSSFQGRKISASKLLRSSCHEARQKPEIEQTIKVIYFSEPSQTEAELQITPDTKVVSALEDLAVQLNLQQAFDFKLYLETRPLEQDENLWNLLIQKKQDEHKLKQFFKKGPATYEQNKKLIYLRKQLYLPLEDEKILYENDLKRVELVAYQIIYDIKNGILKMNQYEYILFTALYLFIKGVTEVNDQNVPYDKIQQFLPSQVYKSVDQLKWQNLIPAFISDFKTQINQVYEQILKQQEKEQQTPMQRQTSIISDKGNQPIQRQSSVTSDKVTGSDHDISHAQVCQLVLIDLVSHTQFYGYTMFPVNPNNESRQNLAQIGQKQWKQYLQKQKKSAQNQQGNRLSDQGAILLGVGYEEIQIYGNYQQTHPVVKIQYRDVKQIKVFPQTMEIQILQNLDQNDFEIKKTYSIRCETLQGFQIKALINEYLEIKEDKEAGGFQMMPSF